MALVQGLSPSGMVWPVVAALTCILLLPLLVLWWILRKLVTAFYQTTFTSLKSVPSVPIRTWKSYLTGHDTWGTAAFLNKVDSRTVAQNINAYRATLGPVFVLRNFLATPTLQIADTEALRHVCSPAAYKYPKTAPARRAMGMLLGADGILFAEGEKHKRIKRIVSPALHHEAVGVFGAALLEEAQELAERFVAACSSEPEKPLKLKEEVGAGTFRAIIRAFVGRSRVSPVRLQALEHAYLECIEQMTIQLPWDILRMAVLNFIPASWITSSRREKLLIRREVMELLDEAIGWQKLKSATETQAPNEKDPAVLLSLMTAASAEAGRLNPSEMTDTMLTFLAAGQATSALSVAWTLHLLARHPAHLVKLQSEIDASGWMAGDTGDAGTADASVKLLDGLPFLHRCVKESLRLHPPASYSIRATAEEDVICGIKVPAGVMVNIPILALHLSERHWGPDPTRFNPDHFLPEKERVRDNLAWCPFLMGSRGCIGRPFAMIEIKAFVAEVVRCCDVSVDPDAPEPLMYGGLSGYPPGLKLYGRPRQNRPGENVINSSLVV